MIAPSQPTPTLFTSANTSLNPPPTIQPQIFWQLLKLPPSPLLPLDHSPPPLTLWHPVRTAALLANTPQRPPNPTAVNAPRTAVLSVIHLPSKPTHSKLATLLSLSLASLAPPPHSPGCKIFTAAAAVRSHGHKTLWANRGAVNVWSQWCTFHLRSDTGPIDPDVVKTETAYWASPHASTNQTLTKQTQAQHKKMTLANSFSKHVRLTVEMGETMCGSVPLSRLTQMSLGLIISVKHLSWINALLLKSGLCYVLRVKAKAH